MARDRTGELARHILCYKTSELDSAAKTVAKQCILDWFAVTLAGLEEPVAQMLRAEIIPGSRGRATIIGSTDRCSPADAALVNGTTSHALDYDDVHLTMLGHATVAVLPAVLALAETEELTGDQVLRAFIAGAEAAALVGTLVMPSHYDRGFHATATLGSFGAAAAAGLLLNLDEAEMRAALGLAGTQAAGLKSMFGTMAKPLHAGKAAANGVLAARLAKRGFTAHPSVLDVPQGFVTTQSDDEAAWDVEFPRQGASIVDTLFKFHAACYLTHSTIEAVRSLRETQRLAPSDIAGIEVHVPAAHLKVCDIPSPRTGLETKFSLRHVCALALHGHDTAAIATYSDGSANAPELIAIRDRVSVHGDLTSVTAAAVMIKTRSGAAWSIETDVGVPDRDLHRQGDRLAAKFRSLAEPVIGAARAERLQSQIDNLERSNDIKRLTSVA